MINRSALWAGLLLLALAGCNSHDPRQGGFFGGVAGLASGNYDDRIEQRETNLAVVQGQGEAMQSEGYQLESANATLAERIYAQEQQLAALDSNIAALESDTRKLKVQKASQEQERVELTRRIKSIKAEIAEVRKQTGTARSAAEIDRLKRRLAELEEEALTLQQIYMGLI